MKIIEHIISHKEWIFSGIGVFVISLLILIYQQRQRAKDKSDQRITAFVENFRNLYKGRGHKLEVLIPAGIASLKNNKEIHRAFDLLIKYVPNHPLRSWKGRVQKVGYKRFFNHVVADGREFNKHSIEEYLSHFEGTNRR